MLALVIEAKWEKSTALLSVWPLHALLRWLRSTFGIVTLLGIPCDGYAGRGHCWWRTAISDGSVLLVALTRVLAAGLSAGPRYGGWASGLRCAGPREPRGRGCPPITGLKPLHDRR